MINVGEPFKMEAIEESERVKFVEWYTRANFDYLSSPIGSRDCALMWKAWQAAIKMKEE